MLQFTIRRLISLIPVVLGASIIIFMLVHLAPGDPVRMMLGEDAEPAEVERLNAIYGFDRPLPVQYVSWLGNALTGDFGQSLRQRTAVTELVFERMGATIELAAASLLLAILLGIPLGVLAATNRNTWIDWGSMVVSLLGVSLPNFWLGLLLLGGVAGLAIAGKLYWHKLLTFLGIRSHLAPLDGQDEDLAESKVAVEK